jgi:Rps23 Pro-64 3,4-dihydroxylase Tpa1-like proline 4-hydroxylase
VVYLNDAWLPEHGGQLRMYLKDGVEHDVVPTGGCLVVFLSGEVPHEVLPPHASACPDRLVPSAWQRAVLSMQKILVSRCLLGHACVTTAGPAGRSTC